MRRTVSLGLRVRTERQIKVRQPLRRAEIVIADSDLRERLVPYGNLIEDELNVHDASFVAGKSAHVRYVVKPNFRSLGPRLGPKMRHAKKVFAGLDAGALRTQLLETGSAVIDFAGEEVRLDSEDVQVSVEAEKHFAAAGDSSTVVVLSTEIDEGLRDEGLYRELLHRVQNLRKEIDIEYTRRIELCIEGSERTERVVAQNRDHLMSETLCVKMAPKEAAAANDTERTFDVDGEAVRVVMTPV